MFYTLLTRWRDFLLRTFDIRVGEFRRVWLMQLNVFLLIQCLWIIKPVVNALFLSRVGIDKLPMVFLLVALTALAVATSYARMLNKMPLSRIMFRTYVFSILSLLAFAILLHFQLFADWMSYLFYIGVALFGLITTSQFWLLGNMIFSSLEAKRLFGFIGAGAIAGGIGGGYLTSVLVPVMDSNNLLFVAAGMLLISLGINRRIWSDFVPTAEQDALARQTRSMHELPFRLIRNSKHLTYLALIMGISVVVAKLVEFQFSAIASASITDPDRLTAFFGFWFSTSNVVSLIIQLMVTQRLIASLGVWRSMFVLPSALFAGAAAVLYSPVLWTGTMLKLFDISLKQSIHKAASELLILPIPMAIKSQAKAFIDIFVDTTATGIGGILLIFLINGLNFSVRAVCLMILLLICLWIYFVFRVRKEYIKAFQDKLGIPRQLPTKKTPLLSDTSVVEELRTILRSGNPEQIIFILDRMEESKDQGLMTDAIPLLKHESPRVRQAALRCLYYFTDHTLVKRIKPLLKDPDDEVRSRAFSCLLAHTRHERVRFIDNALDDPDPVISGAALVGLATEARDNSVMQQVFHLEERLTNIITQSIASHDEQEAEAFLLTAIRTIGYGKLKEYYPMLSDWMNDERPLISRQAMLSAGNSRDPGFVKLLLTFLPDSFTRPVAQKALSRYDPDVLLPIFKNVYEDPETPLEILMQLPALTGTLDTRQAMDFLFSLLKHRDPVLKRQTLEALHTLLSKLPHMTISGKQILPLIKQEAERYKETLALYSTAQHYWKNFDVDSKIGLAAKEMIFLLERRLDNTLERIFLILGLAYPKEVSLPLNQDMQHHDHHSRINMVELLDNILEPALKKAILPILESSIRDSASDDLLNRLEVPIQPEIDFFESLLRGEDGLLKIAVLNLLEALNNPDFASLILLAESDDYPSVRILAEKLLEKE